MATGRVSAGSRPRRVGLESIAFAVLGGCLWITTGLAGVAIAAATLAVRVVSSHGYAIAVGALLWVTISPVAGQSILPVGDALVVFSGFTLLIGSSLVVEWPGRIALVAGAVLVATAVGLVLAGRAGSTAAGIAIVSCSYGLAAYGLHRYGQVRLGLVEEADT